VHDYQLLSKAKPHTVVVARAAKAGIAVATRANRLYDSFMARMSVDARPTSMSRLFKHSGCYNFDQLYPRPTDTGMSVIEAELGY